MLPPGLIASSPEFLRPFAGVKPAGGHFLHFCAFELGRGPNGQWWVLGDRMQAPSGAGFALENRVATTRALSDIYGEMHVHRLAGFFRRFRDALTGLASEPFGRVAILTPGPLNETYFEHAYIARYLGIMLLEGEDLTVADGRLMVRTVSGLKPISVLWRRLDAAFADPLELRSDSQIGTPGLVEAVRRGSVTSVNALGSGILETRALLAFLPRISRGAARRGTGAAVDRHLVVRPGGRAPACDRQFRPHDDRPGAVDAPALRGRQRHGAWLDAVGRATARHCLRASRPMAATSSARRR